MAAWPATGCPHGGGAGIPTFRPPRPRLITGATAVVLAIALASYPVLRAGQFQGGLATLGLLAVGLLAVSLVFWKIRAVPWALLALLVEYVASLLVPPRPVDGWAPVYAGALLLMAELAYWSLEQRWPSRPDPGVDARRGGLLSLLVLGSIGLGAVLLLVAQVPLTGNLLLTAAGVLAAIAALAIVAVAAWRMV